MNHAILFYNGPLHISSFFSSTFNVQYPYITAYTISRLDKMGTILLKHALPSRASGASSASFSSATSVSFVSSIGFSALANI